MDIEERRLRARAYRARRKILDQFVVAVDNHDADALIALCANHEVHNMRGPFPGGIRGSTMGYAFEKAARNPDDWKTRMMGDYIFALSCGQEKLNPPLSQEELDDRLRRWEWPLVYRKKESPQLLPQFRAPEQQYGPG